MTSAAASPSPTSDPAGQGLSQAEFRNAMARMGAAVNIITTDGPAGKAGFAASAVCSVTDSPPTLMICLNRSSSVIETFDRNRTLCVNTLGGSHETLSKLFGGKTPVEDRFAAASWETGTSGAPRLLDATASFDCTVQDSLDVGTHRVLICEVLAVRHAEGATALVYFNRAYHTVAG